MFTRPELLKTCFDRAFNPIITNVSIYESRHVGDMSVCCYPVRSLKSVSLWELLCIVGSFFRVTQPPVSTKDIWNGCQHPRLLKCLIEMRVENGFTQVKCACGELRSREKVGEWASPAFQPCSHGNPFQAFIYSPVRC